MTSNGTPLIEALSGGDEVLVTFLWKDTTDSDVLNVQVTSRLFILEDNMFEPLQRLANTDIWYKTVKAPTQTRLAYLFSWPQGRHPAVDALARRTVDGQKLELFSDPLARYQAPGSQSRQHKTVSYFEGPDAPAETWLLSRDGVSNG